MNDRERGFRPYKKARGLPDIFAFHRDPARMLILELKGNGGKLSDEQRKFLTLARDVGDSSYLWTDTALDTEIPRLDGQRMIGVYVVEPGNLDAIERIIRTRVLS